MEPRLQRRLQRQGWDLAVDAYDPLWQTQLADAQTAVLAGAALAPGDRVLDVACGTGLVTFAAARAVGPSGRVVGVDLAGQMIAAAGRRADALGLANASFARMDAEALAWPDASFDVVLCSLGLMYMPEPAQALREMRRVLRPGGRLALAVWGERSRCGWQAVFGIVAAEVTSEVCPLFFHLGQQDTLARQCATLHFEAVQERRVPTTLVYADGAAASDAAFVGGPAALAWAHFDDVVRDRARTRYLEAIAPWQHGAGYRVPGEFVIVTAMR